jgi:hypothetical protein
MSWHRHTSGQPPPPLGGHSATLVGHTVYIFGGNADIRDLPIADPSHLTFVTAPVAVPSPSPSSNVGPELKNALMNKLFALDTGSIC